MTDTEHESLENALVLASTMLFGATIGIAALKENPAATAWFPALATLLALAALLTIANTDFSRGKDD